MSCEVLECSGKRQRRIDKKEKMERGERDERQIGKFQKEIKIEFKKEKKNGIEEEKGRIGIKSEGSTRRKE